MTAHKLTLNIDDGGETWTLSCPYNRTDVSRPCWPHNEDGTPSTSTSVNNFICTWVTWFDECGTDVVTSLPETSWPVTVEWVGDGPQFFAGEPERVVGT